MDFYVEYKIITRFLFKAAQGVWCGGFVKTKPKSLGSDCTDERIQINTLTVTALSHSCSNNTLSDGVFPRYSKTGLFSQIETCLIFFYYAIGVFFLFTVCDHWLLIIFLLG